MIVQVDMLWSYISAAVLLTLLILLMLWLSNFRFQYSVSSVIEDVSFLLLKYRKSWWNIAFKFRPVKPGSPHLNGKVEHSQQTDLREFYANTDLSNFETLKNQLKEWQFSYNYQHLHGSLKGKTPAQYSGELGVSFHSPKNINSIRSLHPCFWLLCHSIAMFLNESSALTEFLSFCSFLCSDGSILFASCFF